MTSRVFDPYAVDVAAFAKEAGELAGQWPLSTLERLSQSTLAGTPAEPIAWRARGERRSVRGGEHQVWLHVQASVELPLQCQRCLQAVHCPLQCERSFLFVHGEAAAAELDADSDDDVLALTRALDLRVLIEDELLLALPLVPRHDVCPQPLPVAIEPEVTEPAPHPFAVLAALKPPGRLN